MDIFKDFNQGDFRKSFIDLFDLDRILLTSVNIPDNQIEKSEGKFEKQFCIDFAGVAASLFRSPDISHYFERILNSIAWLNKRKIRLHFRFMLVYPYSAHAISRIQAETSRNRTTITEPSLKEVPFDVVGRVESVDYETFWGSNFFTSQRLFLSYIGGMMSKYQLSEHSENRITIRFAPTAVNVCMYRNNDCFFISPYMLAKEKREDNECVARSPVIKVLRGEDRDTFEAYLDHFRYLWNLPQAIYLEDATFYNKNKGIERVKKPREVDYKKKSRRIKAGSCKSDAISWRLQVRELLFRSCKDIPKEMPERESVFIACAWHKKDDYLPSSPNSLAKRLKEWLIEDLCDDVEVHVVEARPGEELSKIIYSELNISTVGIILLTCDFDAHDKYYAKPNIYHELGYLMGKYEGIGYEQRVIPVIQSLKDVTVEVPTNINNTASIYVSEHKIEAVYKDILMSLYTTLGLDVGLVCSALMAHLSRIESIIKTQDDSHARLWADSIHEAIRSLPSCECDVEDCSKMCEQ